MLSKQKFPEKPFLYSIKTIWKLVEGRWVLVVYIEKKWSQHLSWMKGKTPLHLMRKESDLSNPQSPKLFSRKLLVKLWEHILSAQGGFSVITFVSAS